MNRLFSPQFHPLGDLPEKLYPTSLFSAKKEEFQTRTQGRSGLRLKRSTSAGKNDPENGFPPISSVTIVAKIWLLKK
jgi:hypothetical protein